MRYTVSSPGLLRAAYKKRLWSLPAKEKVLYLTFDDGPIPEVTPWVLDQLEKFNAKATFFCIGDNINKHPQVYETVIGRGHSVGNHTQHHVKGWKTPLKEYLKEVHLCQTTMGTASDGYNSKLFRPPYGQLRSNQGRKLLRLGYKVVMWDVLSADFDTEIDGARCSENVIKHAKPGSIVVFHDSIKAFPRLKTALPEVLAYFSERGYTFKCIP